MNWRKIGAFILFVLGLAVALQNFYTGTAAGLSVAQRLYYFVLGLAVMFLSAGAFYVWKKEK
jgi:sterol desaturase/sphingolipid hydroxylase (fatty acid hydroxylase superfamily)